MKHGARRQGAASLAAGGLCWTVNLALARGPGVFSPTLLLLGGLGIAAGAVLLIWGDSYKTLPVAQKIPAALIALAAVALVGMLLWRH